jgi:hypothetical protein
MDAMSDQQVIIMPVLHSEIDFKYKRERNEKPIVPARFIFMGNVCFIIHKHDAL